jgi:hypothetical protein
MYAHARTGDCKIIGTRPTGFNGFLYRFTTETSLKTVEKVSVILQSCSICLCMIVLMFACVHYFFEAFMCIFGMKYIASVSAWMNFCELFVNLGI